MRIAYASDLHLEQDAFLPTEGLSNIDVLILAGDLDTSPVHYPSMIEKIRAVYRGSILMVVGNHEYYGVPFPDGWKEYRDAVADDDQVFVLEKQSMVIDGIRFLGTTLWTDFAEGRQIQNHHLMVSDLAYIRQNDKTPTDARMIIAEHHRCLVWLESQFVQSESLPNQKTVLITHHAPSFMSTHPKHAGSLIAGGFCSNLEEQIERWQPVAWIHGHLHDKAHYRIGETEVLCNPWGYAFEGNECAYAFIDI